MKGVKIREMLYSRGYPRTLVDKYCDEFEHQDGEDCWDNYFTDYEEIVRDFFSTFKTGTMMDQSEKYNHGKALIEGGIKLLAEAYKLLKELDDETDPNTKNASAREYLQSAIDCNNLMDNIAEEMENPNATRIQ
jgi:hypothetical protein